MLVTIASWILAQKTEDHRVVVAEQKAIEDYKNEIITTDDDIDVDPTIEEEIIIDDEIVGDEDGA